MEGIGILSQPDNPFWKLTPPQGVTRNPLGYFCAPNAATPDCVSSYSIGDFLAYGFVCCWDAVSPEYFTMWNMVQADDVKWLREYFLQVVEKLILNFYAGNVQVGAEDFDSDWAEELNIGNSDENDTDEVMLSWCPFCIHEDALAIELRCTDMTGGVGGDPETIWLALEALKDRAAVRKAIEEARKANGLKTDEPHFRSLDKDWEEVIAAQPTEEDE